MGKVKDWVHEHKGATIVIVTLAIVILCGIINDQGKRARAEKKAQETAAKNAAEAARRQANQKNLTAAEKQQASLVQKYGKPPEGFEWSPTGELVALGNDPNATATETVTKYIQALSTEDFSTAARVSKDSSVIKRYNEMYQDVTKDINNTYSNFLRQQYKASLKSIQILGVEDAVKEADGTEIITVKLKLLNLQNRDFWYEDRETLFKNMYNFDRTQDSSSKRDNYLYTYMEDSYGSPEDNWGKVGLYEKTVTIEVGKENGKGYLVTNDGELPDLLRYDKGFDVVAFIKQKYNEWAINQDVDLSIQGKKGDIKNGEDVPDSGYEDEGY